MAKVERSVSDIFGGVSRRPAQQRAEGDFDEQINMLSLARQTNGRRPPTRHLQQLLPSTTGYEAAFVQEIRRGEDDYYLAMIVNGDLKVYDISASPPVAVTVAFPDGKDYINEQNYATLTTALTGANNDLKFTSRLAGVPGNSIAVRYTDTITGSDHALTVSVASNVITVAFQEAGGAIVYPTANTLVTALQASAAAMALVSVELAPSNDGTGLATAMAQTSLSGGSYAPARSFRAVTIGDETIILNRNITTRKGSTTADDSPKEALLYVRQGDYDTRYTVTLNGNTVTHTTPAASRPDIATDEIAADLRSALLAVAAIADVFEITRYGSTLHIENKNDNSIDFTIKANDGLGDQALLAIKGSVQRFTDLPKKAKPGFTVEVKGDDTTRFDNYYVQYQESDSPEEAGTWVEVAKPGSVVAMNPDTLPHVLQYRGSYLNEDAEQVGVLHAPDITTGTHANGGAVVTGKIITFDSTATYPPQSSVSVDLESATYFNTFTYTNSTSGFLTAEQMCEGLRLVIDAHANWVATNIISTTSFEVWNTPADEVFSAWSYTAYDRTVNFADSGLSMTANEHVGRTIRNLTDGSSATISSNGTVSIVCSALSGGADNRFDPGDLVNIEGTGDYFIFRQPQWAQREAGTVETVPFPSFIDRKIRHVFEHAGRLGFLAGPNIVLSRPGDLYNLFRGSAIQLLADDPIDVKSALRSAPQFESATGWDNALLLQTDQGFFRLTGDPVLTAETVVLEPVGSYQSYPEIPLEVLGESAFYVSLRGGIPLVMELRRRGQEQIVTADDTTLGLPAYIKGVPQQLEADEPRGMLFLRTDDDAQTLFVFNWRYLDGQKQQSAWSKWEFAGTQELMSVHSLRGELALVMKSNSAINLLSIPLDTAENPAWDADALRGLVYLDRMVVSGDPNLFVGTDGSTYTEWTLPYTISTDGSEGTLVVVRADTLEKLDSASLTRPGVSLLRYTGADLSAVDVYIGIEYESYLRLSRIYPRTRDGEPLTVGALLLHALGVRYVNSSDLSVDVKIAGRELREYTLANAGDYLLMTGIFRVPVYGRAEETGLTIYTSGPGPMNIEGFTWEGDYFPRGVPIRTDAWWCDAEYAVGDTPPIL